MTIVFMASYIFKRESDIYNVLSLAALFILLLNPRQLFDIGFQLSFISVLSIVYFYPRIKAFFHVDSLKIPCLRFLINGAVVSLSAWLGTMGLVAYYFRIFSPVTILANLFIVPLASLITLSGFSLILAALTFPAASPFFALSLELFTGLLIKINFFLIKLPAAYLYLS